MKEQILNIITVIFWVVLLSIYKKLLGFEDTIIIALAYTIYKINGGDK
jgi:hypothetical protein